MTFEQVAGRALRGARTGEQRLVDVHDDLIAVGGRIDASAWRCRQEGLGEQAQPVRATRGSSVLLISVLCTSVLSTSVLPISAFSFSALSIPALSISAGSLADETSVRASTSSTSAAQTSRPSWGNVSAGARDAVSKSACVRAAPLCVQVPAETSSFAMRSVALSITSGTGASMRFLGFAVTSRSGSEFELGRFPVVLLLDAASR